MVEWKPVVVGSDLLSEEVLVITKDDPVILLTPCLDVRVRLIVVSYRTVHAKAVLCVHRALGPRTTVSLDNLECFAVGDFACGARLASSEAGLGRFEDSLQFTGGVELGKLFVGEDVRGHGS